MHLGDMPGPDLMPVHGERGEAQAFLVRVGAFEKRQTIEAYKRDTVPMIEKFLAYISQAGAGELIFRGGEQGGPCGENNDGYDYWSPNISGKPIEVAEVIKAGDKYLVPAGFTKKTKRQHENGDVTLFWLNKRTVVTSPR